MDELEMDELEQEKHVRNARIKREAGTALLLAALVLGIFVLFLPQRSPKVANLQNTTASSTPNAYAFVTVQAKAAIVYDLAKHKILFAKNSSAQLPLASITKLLTIYTAVKELGMDAPIPITYADIKVDGDSGFKPGEVFRLKNLSRITLAASINDGAAAIARATAAHEGIPVPRMLADSAAALGLSQIYALNGTGLDPNTAISGGYGSTYDVALLAGAFLKEAPGIAEATTQSTVTATSNIGLVHTKKNTDPYVTTMPRVLLSKTGYETLGGGNLVVIFDAAFNHPIAVVVLGSTEKGRFTDVNTLIAATFAHFADIKTL